MGRSGERRRIRQIINDPLKPFIVVIGPTGMGKSQLIARVLHKHEINEDINGYLVFNCQDGELTIAEILDRLMTFLGALKFDVTGLKDYFAAGENLLTNSLSGKNSPEVAKFLRKFVEIWNSLNGNQKYLIVFDAFEHFLSYKIDDDRHRECAFGNTMIESFFQALFGHDWGNCTFIMTSVRRPIFLRFHYGNRFCAIHLKRLHIKQTLIMSEHLQELKSLTIVQKIWLHRITRGNPRSVILVRSYLSMPAARIEDLLRDPELRKRIEDEKIWYQIQKIVERLPKSTKQLFEELCFENEDITEQTINGYLTRGYSQQDFVNLIKYGIIRPIEGHRM